MGQSAIKRKRRNRREYLVKTMIRQLEWCQKNISIKEDGVERPITLNEAADFIYIASTEKMCTETPGPRRDGLKTNSSG
jgi:hypothetical protein